MIENYTLERMNKDLDNGYKILFDYVRNRFALYKVDENCYMQELVEQKTRNPAQEKSMITYKAVKQMFPYMENIEYKVDTSHYGELQKENFDYVMKLEESFKQLEEGKVVTKTMEELKAMANERLNKNGRR